MFDKLSQKQLLAVIAVSWLYLAWTLKDSLFGRLIVVGLGMWYLWVEWQALRLRLRLRRMENTATILEDYQALHERILAFKDGLDGQLPNDQFMHWYRDPTQASRLKQVQTKAAGELQLAALLSDIASFAREVQAAHGVEWRLFNVTVAPSLALLLINPKAQAMLEATTAAADRKAIAYLKKRIRRAPIVRYLTMD